VPSNAIILLHVLLPPIHTRYGLPLAWRGRVGRGGELCVIPEIFCFITRITRNKRKSRGESRLRVTAKLAASIGALIFPGDLFATDLLTFRDFVAVHERDVCKRAVHISGD